MTPHVYGKIAHKHHAHKVFRKELTGEFTLIKDTPGPYVYIERADEPHFYWRNFQVTHDRVVTIGEFTNGEL